MKIFHIADTHLGRRRLDGRLPDTDFAEAFGFIADAAIEADADVFLIAGDLFDRPQVEPQHLGQALEVLRRLKEAGIPVVAVEGNHDKAFVHSESPTWVHHLAAEDLLILLQPRFGPDGAILERWDAETRRGAWIEIGGVRFTGVGYLGAATPNKVRQIVAELDDEPVNVLLLHAGPEYFVGEGGGFSNEDLKGLREKVCYLALGHIHKPMLHGDWACNPGSPENCDLREANYGKIADGSDGGRGYAVVEIDPKDREAPVGIAIRSNPRRPCLRVDLDCTPFGNKTKHGGAALIDEAVKAINAFAPPENAVIDLRLLGRLNLNRIALDQTIAAEEIERESGVFAVAIDPSGLNIEGVFGVSADGDADGISREALERHALRSLVEEDSVWGLDEQRDAFAELLYSLKESVLNGHSDEQLAEQVAGCGLVEQVKAAKVQAVAASESTELESAEMEVAEQ